MKLTNAELINELAPALRGLLSLNLNGKVKAGYAVSKNISKVSSEIKAYEESRSQLADLHAKKDEKGKFVVVEKNLQFETPESETSFRDGQAELLSIEVDIEFHQLDVAELEGIDGITGNMLFALRHMIKE